MERFIHILVIEPDETKHKALRKMLSLAGSIPIFAMDMNTAIWELSRKEIGIVLMKPNKDNSKKLIRTLQEHDKAGRAFFIAYLDDDQRESEVHKILKDGYVDYLFYPFEINIVKAKLRIYKALFLKDQRIGDLLTNIFPNQILKDLNNFGKYSPKRVDKGVVMFTDFVDFSQKSKTLQPLEIVKKLEHYFNKFDEIIHRYRLEKIKTIGDSYMALAGVTENIAQPTVRACLAALEIREFMENEQLLAQAMKRETWQIRIGIHVGPLVAGILSSDKMSFDVWGDTVNLASRAEQNSWPGQITITDSVAKEIQQFFYLENRGKIEIKKRGGEIQMFFIQQLKESYCQYDEGLQPSTELRVKCGLSPMDFNSMRKDILNRLKTLLPDDLIYHDVDHTIGVEKSAIRLAKLEGLSEEEELILRTAVLYHDAGFIFQYDNNEQFGVKMARSALPKYGYSDEQIDQVCEIILSTRNSAHPSTLLEKIMSDSDHDYFGRAEYYHIAKRLREELSNQNIDFTEEEWIEFQLGYVDKKHHYYTDSSIGIRLPSKKKRINELKRKLIEIQNKK